MVERGSLRVHITSKKIVVGQFGVWICRTHFHGRKCLLQRKGLQTIARERERDERSCLLETFKLIVEFSVKQQTSVWRFRSDGVWLFVRYKKYFELSFTTGRKQNITRANFISYRKTSQADTIFPLYQEKTNELKRTLIQTFTLKPNLFQQKKSFFLSRAFLLVEFIIMFIL